MARIADDVIDRLSRTVVSITADAEADLLQRLARQLARNSARPSWAELQLAQVVRLRASWASLVDAYLANSRTEVGLAIARAGEHGEKLAIEALHSVLRDAPVRLPGSGGVLALAEELAGVIASTRSGVLRSTEDIFRRVIADVTGRALLGGQTRLGIAEQALGQLAARGVAGFVDRAGRQWELASYVEMATRTACQRAMTRAHHDTLAASGVDLIIVSDAPQECRLCRPWEGKVLSIGGASGAREEQVRSAVSDEMVTVRIAGSYADAQRGGLHHPNCRHSTSAYFPGLTTPPRPEPADPDGDAARRRLRALERDLRAEKRTAMVAITPGEKARAAARVRRVQALIREHVDATTAKRQPHREQIGRAR